MTPKEKKNISLVKTDYDDFKDLSFFLDQQTKAEAMLREVEEFKKSFVMSKMISMGEWVQKNPTKAVDIFCGAHLCLEPTPPKKSDSRELKAYIETYCPTPYEFKKGSYSEKRIKEKISANKLKLIQKFYEDVNYGYHYDFSTEQFIHQHRNQIKIPVPGTNQYTIDYEKEDIIVPEEQTTCIVTNWRDYVKPEYLKLIEEDGFMERYLNTPEFKKRIDNFKSYEDKRDYIWSIFRNEVEVISSALYIDKIQETLRQRYPYAVEAIYDVWTAYPDIPISALHKKIVPTRFSMRVDSDAANCVLWKGELVWVSNHLDDVKITTSDDRKKIYCTFEDKTTYKEQNYFDYKIQEERSCILTYSAENNELVDYKVYTNKTKLCDRRYYD